MLLVIDDLETPDLLGQDIMLHALITELNNCQNSSSRLLITTCNGQMCRVLESLGCAVQDFKLTTDDNEQHVMQELLCMLSKDRTDSGAVYEDPSRALMVRILDSVSVPCNHSCLCQPLGSGASYCSPNSVNLKTPSGRECSHVLCHGGVCFDLSQRVRGEPRSSV